MDFMVFCSFPSVLLRGQARTSADPQSPNRAARGTVQGYCKTRILPGVSPKNTIKAIIPRRQESIPILRHSRAGGNPPRHPSPHTPSFPRRRESTSPANAGIQRKETPSRLTRHPIPTQNYLNVIPAKAGLHPVIRHSREGGNPQFPRTREFNENTIQTDQTPHSHTELPQRHSRAGGNPLSHYPDA